MRARAGGGERASDERAEAAPGSCGGARAGEYMMGWANEGCPSPTRPPATAASDKSPPYAMYFWLSVFALSTLLVMCASPRPADPACHSVAHLSQRAE